MNNSMWLYTHFDESQWVEMGLVIGHWTGCLSCTNTYTAYWADMDLNGTLHGHIIAYPSADLSVHSYEIVEDPGTPTNWDIYYDGNYKGVSTNQYSDIAFEAQTGLEVTRATDITWAHSDTFHDAYLNVYSFQKRAWLYWWYQNHHNDRPCGQYVTGQCMNGSEPSCGSGCTQPGTTEWDVNKP